MSAPKKVVLAYSGGLDTSIILKWLQTEYGCEVVTFTADLGQGEELEPARKKAEMMGAKEIYIEDLREEFVRDFVFPMFRANAVYEGLYLLGTSIARPLISKRLVEIADEQLSSNLFLTGQDFTLADIQLGHILYRYYDIDISRAYLPNLRRYYEALTERAAYREHVMISYEELRAS